MKSSSRTANACRIVRLSNHLELENAQHEASSFHSEDSDKGVAFLLSDPRFLASHAAAIEALLSSRDSSSSNNNSEVKLVIRGMGKPLMGHRPAAAAAMARQEEERANTVHADTVAALLRALVANGQNKVTSLEISVGKLQGSLVALQEALVVAAPHLERVVLHQCDNGRGDARHQGLLPLLETLATSCPNLSTLVLESITFPVGDLTANALEPLAHIAHLEFKHCIHLGDEELLPLVRKLQSQQFKLSTGFFQDHQMGGHTWGNPVVKALAKLLKNKESCNLTSLSLIATSSTTTSTLSLRPIVQAMKHNTTVQRLHLYQNTTPVATEWANTTAPMSLKRSRGARSSKVTPKSMAEELVDILATNQNMTLVHCNNLGGGPVTAAMHFYLKMNQLNRKALFQSFASNHHDNNATTTTTTSGSSNEWIQTLLQHSNDHRVVHYLLMNHPSLLLTLPGLEV